MTRATSHEPLTPASRRAFCATACQAASAWVVAVSVGASRESSPLPTVRGEVVASTVRVPTETSVLSAVGGRVRVVSNAGSFLVARTGDRMFVVLTAICSHEACAVTDVEADDYVCPCHGSRFSATGHVVTGPAELALEPFAAVFADGVLTIAL